MRQITACLALLALGCAAPDPLEIAGTHGTAGPMVVPDPLAIEDVAAPPGSLDELHKKVILRSCAGQPGLCHAGQFEPNLATPALTYANLVNRPSIEKERERLFRVRPRDVDKSVLMMKLRGRDVQTRMPLGAPPLSEEEIGLFAAWIREGAKRTPTAKEAPLLNIPPLPPEVALFDNLGKRIDQMGPVSLAKGETLNVRLSTRDFETADRDVPMVLCTLSTNDGRNLLLAEGGTSPQVGFARYDEAGAPAGSGLTWLFRFTIPATLKFVNGLGQISEEPAGGQSFNVLGLYVDSLPLDTGISTFAFRPDLVRVK